MEPSTSSSRHEPTTKTCRFFQLPHSLVLDICSRLPVKDLLHCRCVCKRFLCLVSDPEFASLHLSRSHLCILIKTNPQRKTSKKLQLFHPDDDGASFQVSKLYELNFTPKSNVPTWDISQMNACNGFLFLAGPKTDDPFYVCNPILGEFITIQPPYEDRIKGWFWGLGYSTATHQYKVLQSFNSNGDESETDHRIVAEIYTMGTGTWRSIGNAPTALVSLAFNAFLNGALHWTHFTSGGGEFIHTLDFDTERFGIVPPPRHLQELTKAFPNFKETGVLGGCLFVIFLMDALELHIWVMKEYGVEESWSKQFAIRTLITLAGMISIHQWLF